MTHDLAVGSFACGDVDGWQVMAVGETRIHLLILKLLECHHDETGLKGTRRRHPRGSRRTPGEAATPGRVLSQPAVPWPRRAVRFRRRAGLSCLPRGIRRRHPVPLPSPGHRADHRQFLGTDDLTARTEILHRLTRAVCSDGFPVITVLTRDLRHDASQTSAVRGGVIGLCGMSRAASLCP